MADNVSVIFSAQIGQLIAGVDEVKQSIQSIASPIANLTGALGSVGEAFAAAFAVEKIDSFFSHFADLAIQTQRNAALLGVSVQSIGGLDIAAKESGGSVETLVMSMGRLGLALARAGGGSEQAKAGLAALGISVKEFQSLTPEKQLETMADKFSVLKDGIDKDAIAMSLLGRGGQQMIPTFNQGSAAFQEFAAMADRAGSAMDASMVASLKETHAQLTELDKSLEGVGITMASTFKTAFEGAVKILIDMVQDFNDAVKAGGYMADMMSGLANVAKGLVTAFDVVIMSIKDIWSALMLAGDGLEIFADTVSTFFSKMSGGFVNDALNAFKQLGPHMADAFERFQTSITANANETVTHLNTIWGEAARSEVGIAQTKHAKLDILNKDAVGSALAAAQEQIRIADLQYQNAAEKINTEFKLMQISESGKTQALLAALDVRHAAELAALDQEAAVHGLSKAQYQKVLNEKLQLDQKYTNDRQKIIDQAAVDEANAWKAGADQIAGAFASQNKALLSGQETLGQAMKNISADVALQLIAYGEKWVIEHLAQIIRVQLFDRAMDALGLSTHIATETAKTTATVAGASARAAAETTGQGAGILAQIGNAFAVITADAAKTFAGVFAFLAPALGPAAAGPATAAAATVEASAGAIAVPGLAVGTDYVISPGLAFLHPGESVVPVAQTSGPFTGQGGGSQQINLNLSAFNPSGLQSLIRGMVPQLARELARYQPLNPSLNA